MNNPPKIEDFTFEFIRKQQIGHPIQQMFEWEGFVIDKINNVKHGTKFNFGQNSPSNDELFNSFLDKDNFKKNWWIEIDIPKCPDIVKDKGQDTGNSSFEI